jgi:hypothetical protein
VTYAFHSSYPALFSTALNFQILKNDAYFGLEGNPRWDLNLKETAKIFF